MLHLEDLRQYCLLKPGVEESFPFDETTLVFKVNGKMFLLVGLDSEQLSFNVKCDPDIALELRETYAAVQPGYHMNKKHWNTVLVDGSIGRSVLYGFIDASYELVSAKKSAKKK